MNKEITYVGSIELYHYLKPTSTMQEAISQIPTIMQTQHSSFILKVKSPPDIYASHD